MEQELNFKNIAVIGCGAAGGFASILISQNPFCNVVAFDSKEPFSTLLPTGGGRCNITFEETDIFELARNYPRGEKFLLSVFSKCGVEKTRNLFADLGVKTYVQEDRRVFPVSNSSKKTIEILSKHLKNSNFTHKREKVFTIKKQGEKFFLQTAMNEYEFDAVVIPSITGPSIILNRNLIYTAVTRAKKAVILVGQKQYLQKMINTKYILHRNTLLYDFLKTANNATKELFE